MSIQTSHPAAPEKLTNGVMESSKDKSDVFGKSSGAAAAASTTVVVPVDQKWNVSSECPPPIDFSAEGLQDNGDGKGGKSNQPKGSRSKNKKANWKPLPISISTNDTRERDIRGGSTTRGEIKVNHHHNKFRDKKQPQQNNQQQPMQQSQQQQHQQTAPSNHNNNNRNHTHHSNSHQPHHAHYHHSHHHQNNNHHHNNQNHNSSHHPSSGSSSSAGAAAQSNPTASETTEEASNSKATPVGGGSAGGHRWSSSSQQNSGNNSGNSTTTSNTTPRKSQQQHNQVPHYTNSNDSSSSSSYYHPSGYSRVNSVGSNHGGGNNNRPGKGNNSNSSLPPKSTSSNLNNNSSSNHRSNNFSVHHRNRGPNHYHQYNNNGSKAGSEIASSSAGPSSIAGGSTPGGSGRATPINGFVPAMISAVPIEYTAGGGVSPHTIDQGVGVPPPQPTPVYYVVSTLPPSSDPKNPSVGAGGTTTATLSPVLSVPAGTVVVPTPSFAVTGPTAVSASTNLAPFYAPNVLTTFTTIPTTASGTAAVAPPGVAVAPTAVPFIPPPHPHHHHAHHPHAHPIHAHTHAHHIHGVVPVGVVTPLVPAVPLDPDELMDKIRSQIEYYFSEANLQKDVFIRKKMDSEGFLPISLIASFHRVQSLTQDVAMIIESLKDSTELELSENRLKVRPRINPTIWPLRDEVSNTSTTIAPTSTSSGNELTTTSS